MKTLIVDDEPIARRILREELEAISQVAIVGEAENGKQALQQIAELKPDLVFLDLQMPIMGGFGVVQKLSGGYLPIIVIVTAFDQHASEAFDAGAVDYLLKPVGEERLRKAIERAKKLHKNPLDIANEVAKIVSASAPPNSVSGRKIVGRNGGEYFLLDPDEILAFSGRRGAGVGHYREAAVLGDSNASRDRRSSKGPAIRAGASQRDRKRESRAQDECDEQSTLAHHAQ